MKRKKWLYLAVGLVAILALLVPGCAKKVEAPGELKVGLIFSTSGPFAPMARIWRDATLFTIDIWNDKGGVTVDGRQYTIVPVEYDAASDPGTGAAVTTRAIEMDKVKVIFGDIFDAVCLAQQPIIEEAKIPWMTTAGVEQLLGPGINYTFRIGPTIGIICEKETREATEYFGVRTWCLLAETGAMGKTTCEAAEEFIPKYGGEVLSTDYFSPGTTDFHAVLTKIKSLNPDIVRVVTGTIETATIFLQADELGLKPKEWMISNIVVIPQLMGAVGDLAVGTMLYTLPDAMTDERPVAKEFVSELIARKGEEAAPMLALFYPIMYDGVNRMFMAIEHVNSFDADEICRGLKEVEWVGVGTTGSFDETGQATIRGWMHIIQPDGSLKELIPH